MMMRKVIVLLILILFTPTMIHSLDFYAADLYVYSPEGPAVKEEQSSYSRFFFNYLNQQSFKQNRAVELQRIEEEIESKQQDVKSILIAEDLCLRLNVDYLIYGYIKVTPTLFDMAVRLYSSREKRVLTVVYSRESRQSSSDYEKLLPLLQNAALKTGRELEKIFKLPLRAGPDQILENKKAQAKSETEHSPPVNKNKKIKVKKKQAGFGPGKKERPYHYLEGIKLYQAAGCPVPLPGYWQAITGLALAETGFYFDTVPLYHFNPHVLFRLGLGMSFAYAFAVNKPGKIESYLHTFQWKAPLRIGFEFYRRLAILYEFGPQAQLDFVMLKPLYREPCYKFSAGFSLFHSLAFEILLGQKRRFGLGQKNSFDFTLYQPVLITYKAQVYLSVKLFFKWSQTDEKM